MKTYTLTESELQELKKIRNYFGEHDKTSFEHSAFDFLNNLINSATEEVGIKEDNYVPNVQPKDLASLASHSCASNDSIQQDYDELVKRFNELNEKYFALHTENRKLILENQDLIKKVKIL